MLVQATFGLGGFAAGAAHSQSLISLLHQQRMGTAVTHCSAVRPLDIALIRGISSYTWSGDAHPPAAHIRPRWESERSFIGGPRRGGGVRRAAEGGVAAPFVGTGTLCGGVAALFVGTGALCGGDCGNCCDCCDCCDCCCCCGGDCCCCGVGGGDCCCDCCCRCCCCD